VPATIAGILIMLMMLSGFAALNVPNVAAGLVSAHYPCVISSVNSCGAAMTNGFRQSACGAYEGRVPAAPSNQRKAHRNSRGASGRDVDLR
jgi:hypothetical protein